MDMACGFLNYRQEVLPFKYLGQPVGVNSSKEATWEPLLEQLRNRLHSWGTHCPSEFGAKFNPNSLSIFFESTGESA